MSNDTPQPRLFGSLKYTATEAVWNPTLGNELENFSQHRVSGGCAQSKGRKLCSTAWKTGADQALRAFRSPKLAQHLE